MNWLATAASLITAAGVLGGGLYKLGSGLLAMAATVRELVAYHEDHEARIRVLEAGRGTQPPAGPGH